MAPDSVKQRRLDGVLEWTKAAQDRGTDPLIWAMQLSSTLATTGVSLPSVELADLLVSHICWSNNVPIAWKFLDKALSVRIVPPMLVLALLSTRVIPTRRRYPSAYRLYMELLRRYAFSLPSLVNGPNYHQIMESIGDALKLHNVFRTPSTESGLLLVEFIFSIVWELLDASLDDEALLELTPEKKSRWPIMSQEMDDDCLGSFDGKKMEHQVALSKMNPVMAIEMIGEFLQHTLTSQILCLARWNLPMHWECFNRNLRLLAANSSSLRNSNIYLRRHCCS